MRRFLAAVPHGLRGAIAAALLAGCGIEDDRPATLEYIHAAIIQPSCATANCHSSFAKADFYDFGTLESTRVGFDRLVEPGAAAESELIRVLTSPGGEGGPTRMPYDAPLPNADINLIFTWIELGAEGL